MSDPGAELRRPHRGWLLATLLLVAAAYHGVAGAQFVFDDHPSILDSAGIQEHDFLAAAFGDQHTPIANRPLVCLSFVLQHALHGNAPMGWHLGNLLLHLLNVGLLWALVSAALAAPNLRSQVSPWLSRALPPVLVALWAVHPLGVDAVAYVTQRTTLLMSAFVLLALWSALAAQGSPRPWRWRWLCVLALACAMASKEEAVAAPILVVLCERAFVLPDWRSLRARWRFHLALALPWLLLGLCVALGPRNPTVGYATVPVATAVDWLCTQAGVLVHYLGLVLWPQGLRGAYDSVLVRSLAPAVLPGLLLLFLLAGAVLAFRRAPWLGFLGALFFLLLGPTSSVLPIVTEVAAERRMYLPMLLVLVPLAVVAVRALESRPRVLAAGAAMLVMAAAVRTWQRVAVYRDEASFWADAFAQADPHNRSFLAGQVFCNQALQLRARGDLAAALPLLERAVACEHPTPLVRMHHATALVEAGQSDAGERLLRGLLAERPQDPAVAGALGMALAWRYDGLPATAKRGAQDAGLQEAASLLAVATAVRRPAAAHCHARGVVALELGERSVAAAWLLRAVELEPRRSLGLLVDVLEGLGRGPEALAAVTAGLLRVPGDVGWRERLADELGRRRRYAAAIVVVEDLLRLSPEHGPARQLLSELRARR